VSPDTTVANASQATLTGSVGDGLSSGLASTTAAASTAGITVSVVGAPETTTVDTAGRFRLVFTPSGNLVVKLTGPSVASTATVGTVTAGDSIEITISIVNGSAELEDLDRNSSQMREIEGRVEAIPPTTAAGTFKVAGKLVTTSSATVFHHGDTAGTFADVLLGSRVHVKATATTGTTLTATDVNIQNTQTQLPVQLNGTISGFSGTASAFAFDIGGYHVLGNSTTSFTGNSAFSDMANNARAEVKAEFRSTGLFATSIHVNK